MKTLLLSENFPPKNGGSGRWFWEIYRRLPRERFVLAAGEDPRQFEFDATHDLRLERLPLSMRQWGIASLEGLRGYVGNICRLRSLVRRHQITRIHCGRCLPEGVMSLALKTWTGTPYVCYVHGEDVNTAVNSREHALLVRRVLSGVEYCIANSRNSARLLAENWRVPEERIRTLYPGVDTQRFSPAPRDEDVRRRFGWGARPVVLTVGRLQRRKGQDTMIRALPRIAASIPDVLYAIVGDGEARVELENLAHACGVARHVQFCGEIGDAALVDCYRQCDLFVLPNREIDGDIEGFGMVLLEAQACGKPVIAGDSGGTAETMDIGETGYLLDCRSPDPLAEVVSRLLTCPARCEAMGRAGRRWAVERFDWSALARQANSWFCEN